MAAALPLVGTGLACSGPTAGLGAMGEGLGLVDDGLAAVGARGGELGDADISVMMKTM